MVIGHVRVVAFRSFLIRGQKWLFKPYSLAKARLRGSRGVDGGLAGVTLDPYGNF